MDSIRTGMSVSNTSFPKAAVKTAKSEPQAPVVQDGFTKSVDTEIAVRPEVKYEPDKKIWESIAAIGTDSANQAAGATGSGPIYKSIAGSIAKLLISTVIGEKIISLNFLTQKTILQFEHR